MTTLTITGESSVNDRAASISMAVENWLNAEIAAGSSPSDLVDPFVQEMGLALGVFTQLIAPPQHKDAAMRVLLKMIAIYADASHVEDVAVN